MTFHSNVFEIHLNMLIDVFTLRMRNLQLETYSSSICHKVYFSIIHLYKKELRYVFQ